MNRTFDMAVEADMRTEASWPTRLHEELRQVAAAYFRRERKGHTLQPTAIVSEVWLRLLNNRHLRIDDRDQFLAVAATTVRRILVDHARKKGAVKRGRDRTTGAEAFDTVAVYEDPNRFLELDEALEDLCALHPRSARVVEMRFFGGMRIDSIAAVLNVTERTVRNDWAVARAWLRQRLVEGIA